MYSKCCSGNFSSCSLGSTLRHQDSSCGLSYPGKLVYSPNLCSPSSCQLGSLNSGCQETCYQPIRCRTSCVVSSPCQTSCYRPRMPILCSPCQAIYTRPLGCASRSICSLHFRSRSCYSLGCGSAGFKPQAYAIRGLPSLGYGANFYPPICFSSRSSCSSC